MTTPLNLCRGCGQDFTSLRLFDAHRVGRHAYTLSEGLRMNPPRDDGRRCLYVEEMRAKGWKLDERGRWADPARARDARERLSAVSGSPQEASGGVERTAEAVTGEAR